MKRYRNSLSTSCVRDTEAVFDGNEGDKCFGLFADFAEPEYVLLSAQQCGTESGNLVQINELGLVQLLADGLWRPERRKDDAGGEKDSGIFGMIGCGDDAQRLGDVDIGAGTMVRGVERLSAFQGEKDKIGGDGIDGAMAGS